MALSVSQYPCHSGKNSNMRKIVFLLLLLPTFIFAGVKERIKAYLQSRVDHSMITSEIHCGFHYELDLLEHYHELSPELKIMAINSRLMPLMQANYISAEGHFKIYYDTTGNAAVDTEDISGNGIPDYVDSAAAIFDHVWQVEIEEMGFQSPPNMGSDYYEVFINNQAIYGYYGQTVILNINDPSTIKSYIEIDKSFTSSAFYTQGLDALRVTAAHEFNHALQLGYQFHLSRDRFFMEMTSTWLEDLLYPAVNDFYAYLPRFFNNINYISFNSPSSVYPYANSIYLHMLADKFSPNIVVDVWDKINQLDAMPAIDAVLKENGSGFNVSQNEYATWLYYTGERAIPNIFFSDASEFPMLTFTADRNLFYHENFNFETKMSDLGYKFYQVKGLQNIRYMANISSVIQSGLYTHLNAQELPELAKSFNHSQAVKFDIQDSIVVVITNPDTSVNVTYTLRSDTTQPFLVGPNPVILDSDDKKINFYNVPPQGEIYVFSLNGKSLMKIVSEFPGKSDISWNVRDYNNVPLSSGIYFYIVKSEQFEKRGKFAVIRK